MEFASIVWNSFVELIEQLGPIGLLAVIILFRDEIKDIVARLIKKNGEKSANQSSNTRVISASTNGHLKKEDLDRHKQLCTAELAKTFGIIDTRLDMGEKKFTEITKKIDKNQDTIIGHLIDMKKGK